MNINQVKKKLKEKWKVDPLNLWIPLKGNVITNTYYFDARELEENFGYEAVNRIVNVLEEEVIYEFNEMNEVTTISYLNIRGFSGIETFYTNRNVDWVIYLSHEQTIGFAGEKLINELKKLWEDGHKYSNPWERSELTSTELRNIEIEKRKPIWKILSILYLDTELQDSDYKLIVETLIDSRKTIKLLKEIDLFEVFPVLKVNLRSVAGVWIEFDNDWLSKQCEEVYDKRNSYFYRLKVRFYNRFFKTMRMEHWIEIEKRMKRATTMAISNSALSGRYCS